jgi:hypothetical protein
MTGTHVTIPADLLAEIRDDLEVGAPASLRWKPKITDGADDVLILHSDNPYAVGAVDASLDADEPWPWPHLMTSVDGIGPVWAEAWAPVGEIRHGTMPRVGDRVLVLDAPLAWLRGKVGVVRPVVQAPGVVVDGSEDRFMIYRWAVLPPAQPTPSEASTPDSPHEDAQPSPARPWRLGQAWAAHDGPLVTIAEEGTGPADKQGRRRDDRLVGAMGREDAERVVAAVNALRDLKAWLATERDEWRRLDRADPRGDVVAHVLDHISDLEAR